MLFQTPTTTTPLSSKTYLSVPTTRVPVTTPSFDAKKILQPLDSTDLPPITIENISIEEYPTDPYYELASENGDQYQLPENYNITER